MGKTRLQTPGFLSADKTEDAPDATLTSGAGVFGAWVELFPNTVIIHDWITVTLHDNNTSNEYEVEIGQGAVGSEVAKIKGILFHVDLTGMNTITLASNYKVEVPAGSRISARVKSAAATDTIRIKLNAQGT